VHPTGEVAAISSEGEVRHSAPFGPL
jgi:hypothetical protein